MTEPTSAASSPSDKTMAAVERIMKDAIQISRMSAQRTRFRVKPGMPRALQIRIRRSRHILSRMRQTEAA